MCATRFDREPQKPSTLPTVIIESMACGTPVVSSDHETRVQFIRHGENGLVVKEGDVAGWGNAVLSLLSEEGLSQGISENGLATVARRFDADERASELLALFDEDQGPACRSH